MSRTGAKHPLAARMSREFGPAGPVARQAVQDLYEACNAEREPCVASRGPRQRLAGGLSEAGTTASRAGIEALAQAYNVPRRGLRPADLVRAVETYYAVLVSCWVSRALGGSGPTGRDPWVTSLLGCPGSGAASSPWVFLGDSNLVSQLVGRLGDPLARYDAQEIRAASQGGHDLLQDLYQAVFPRRFRHAAGEYYTPPWLAEAMLDEGGWTGQAGQRLLDPACGSGAFLLLAIRRLRSQSTSTSALVGEIVAGVVGLDRNPLAVLTARANYLLALGDLLRPDEPIHVPVYCCDSILGPGPGEAPPLGRFDCVVGNPPWIAWDHLPADYREATKPLWQHYGLFSLPAAEARHGGGKKDLSMLMTYVAADRYLKDSGRLAMVITQTLFQTKGAGDGFRRFRLGAEGAWLRVRRVNDLVALRPFPGVANWTATISLEKGTPTQYPVPYVRWLPGSRQEQFEARPVDPDRPTSPWFLWPQGWKDPKVPLLGPSDYRAHLGANSGGANGVYWVTLIDRRDEKAESGKRKADSCRALACPLSAFRFPLSPHASPSRRAPHDCVWIRNLPARGKHAVPGVEHLVEAELLFPLLRWADVARYRAVPRDWWLLVQDAQTRKGIEEDLMRRRYPHACAYLEQFREVLSARAAYRRYQGRAAFYSMYDVGPYTLAPIKVVWRRMDRRISAAVVEPLDDPVLGPRPVIPQETCVLIAAESPGEAHYLCALLNSAIVGFLVGSHSVRGGKGFGSPGMLDYLRLRRFDPENAAHQELAALSQEAHRLAARDEDYGDVQRQIDRIAGQL